MKTPLYDEHVALGAKMVPFAGWQMPLLYKGIIPEHRATREGASVFDTCHMGVFDFSGTSALRDLERLLTLSVASLKPGAGAYGYLLSETGGVLDDVICFRLGLDSFRLVGNAGTRERDAAWIAERVSAGTRFDDVSPRTAKLDAQGPASRQRAEQAFGLRIPDMGRFRFVEMKIMGFPTMVCRTGYTGEWGYEFFFPADAASRFWKALIQKGGMEPAGLGARDVLRLEMGYSLYGHELSEDSVPVSASGRRFIDRSKEFIGKPAIERELEQGAARVLVGLLMEGRQAARQGDQVQHDAKTVGEVTSGLFSPSLGRAVALAYLDAALSESGQALDVNVRDKPLKARVAQLPFYKKGTAASIETS